MNSFLLICLLCFFTLSDQVQAKALLSFFNAPYFDQIQYQTVQSSLDLQEWLSFNYSVSVLFTNFEEDAISPTFDTSVAHLWELGKIPIITWMPQRNNATWNALATALIASGAEDVYLRSFLTRLQTFIAGEDGVLGSADDRRAYIRLGHEMNGGWYPYSQGENTAVSFTRMWVHIVNMTREEFKLDKDQVAFMWCVDTVDGVKGAPAESWFPGTKYVEWIGIDGYNPGQTLKNGIWLPPGIIFKRMIGRMEKYGKPIAIPEFGSVPALPWSDKDSCATAQGQHDKSWWILDALSIFKQHPSIQLISYFNINKEDPGSRRGQSWAVLSTALQNDANCAALCFCSEGLGTFTAASNISYNVYPEFKARIAQDGGYWIPADPLNPRIVDSSQFLGVVSEIA